MIYDTAMARRYGPGRRLRQSDMDRWMAAARPYLGAAVLDLGAGTGRFTAALAATTGGMVVACEPSGPMRERCPARPVVGGAAEALPFHDGSFDAVWASQMVHHVRDLDAFAAGVRRVLRPGGRLLLRGGFGRPEELPLHRYFPGAWPDPGQMAALLVRVTDTLAAAGMPLTARRKVTQVVAESPEDFLVRARSRSLSNLATLDDRLFEAGLRELERDAGAGRLPERIDEELDLIVFTAGTGAD
jgi:ubiquinone/menaquinone biosynthesis C-methylase UbiE